MGYQMRGRQIPFQSQVMRGFGQGQPNYPCQGQVSWEQFCGSGRLAYDLDQSFHAIEQGAPPSQVFYELDRRDVSGRMDRYGTPSMGELLGDWLNALKGAGEGMAKGVLYSVTAPLTYTAHRFQAMGRNSAWAMKNHFQFMGQRLGQGMNFMRYNRPGFCGRNMQYPTNYQYMCGDPYSGYRY